MKNNFLAHYKRNRDRPHNIHALRMLKCCRCGKPGWSQWKVCADGPYRVFCAKCDAAANSLLLRFAKHPRAKVLMFRYQETMMRELDDQAQSLLLALKEAVARNKTPNATVQATAASGGRLQRRVGRQNVKRSDDG